jgi:uncharacterized protein YozE (UPF0346 family)
VRLAKMAKFKTFYEWLLEEKNRKSPLGDLAREAAHDVSFPKDVANMDALLTYLRTAKASGASLATARIAWQRYSRAHKPRE